jgi:HEAT repeat protein
MLRRWQGFANGIAAAAFSPGGRLALLASVGRKKGDAWLAGTDLDLHLWDLREGKEMQAFSGHRAEVYCIAISTDGRLALSGGRDRIIRMWEVPGGKEINRLVGHTNTVNSVVFSPDGKYALSGGSDQTVRYWDLERGVEVRQLPGHQDLVWAVALSPDGRQALSAGGYQPGPDNKGLVPGNKDFAVRLWDVTTGKELRRFEGHTDVVSAVAFLPDGRRILTAGADRTVRLWQVSSGRQMHAFTGHTKLISALAVSPDGRRALSGGGGGQLKMWELPAEVTDLVRTLRDGPTPAQRVRAAEQLAFYGAEARDAVPDLLRAAAGEDHALRKASLAALVLIGKPRVDDLPLLEPLLQASAPLELRRHVLDSLALLGPEAKSATSSIVALLKDAEVEIRVQAARALGRLGPASRGTVHAPLVEALRDPEPAVGKAAREALTALGPTDADDVKTFAGLLGDQSEPVRRYALDSLTAMKETARPALTELARTAGKDASVELRRLALHSLTVIAPRDRVTLDALRAALADSDATVARQAVTALAATDLALALPGLLSALEHADAAVVKAADEALTNTKWEKTHARMLGEALPMAAPKAQERLLKALAGLGADAVDALPALRALLKKREGKDALPIIEAIGTMGAAAKAAGPELVPFLKRDPKAKEHPVALATAHVLVEIEATETAEGVPLLVSALRIENEQEASLERREKAGKALLKIGKPAVPQLARSLEGEFYIGQARTPAGLARAVARIRVIEVLATMGAKAAATPDVFRVLNYLERNEPYPEVRQAAQAARVMLMKKEEPPPGDGQGKDK